LILAFQAIHKTLGFQTIPLTLIFQINNKTNRCIFNTLHVIVDLLMFIGLLTQEDFVIFLDAPSHF